jgi:hypothetical protein
VTAAKKKHEHAWRVYLLRKKAEALGVVRAPGRADHEALRTRGSPSKTILRARFSSSESRKKQEARTPARPRARIQRVIISPSEAPRQRWRGASLGVLDAPSLAAALGGPENSAIAM